VLSVAPAAALSITITAAKNTACLCL